MMKNSFLMTLVLLVAFGGAYAQEVSLEDLLQKAKTHSPQSETLPLIQQAADAQLKMLNGNYLPQAGINGQATWQSDVTSINISLPGVSILPPPKDQYKITLDLNQSLYDGGMVAKQKELTKAQQLSEEKKVLTDLQQIDEQVSNLYFGILLSIKQKANAKLMLSEINDKIEKAQAGLANGVAIRANVLNLQAKKLELEQQIVDIANRKLSAVQALTLLTGQPIDVSGNFAEPSLMTLALEENKRLELDFLDAQANTLKASEGVIRAKTMPKLGLFATTGYGRPALNFLARDFKPYFIGGAQLKIPLSQLYNNSSSQEIQQLKINQLKIDKQKENFLLISDIRKSNQVNEIDRLKAQIESDKELIGIREQIRKVADAQLENGIITASDYLTELNKEDIAKQALALHEVQLIQAKQTLKLILGQ